MIDIQLLINDLSEALDETWIVEDALTMEPVDAKDLGNKNLLSIYQGDEVFSVAGESPASQECVSNIEFLIVCKQAELKTRMKEVRDAVFQWRGDDDYHALYRKLYAVSGETLKVTGDFIWRRERWVTVYKI